MRSYIRPLIVTFSCLALASLFSYAAIALTEPTLQPKTKAASPEFKTTSKPASSPATRKQEDAEVAHEAELQRLFYKALAKAEAGDTDAMFELAGGYLVGLGTPIDRAAASKWLHLAAEKGHTQAQFSFGQALLRGEICPKDIPQSIRWFRLAAEKANPDAELSLAQLYRDGIGVTADEKESLRWLKLSATHGHPVAQSDYAFAILDEDDRELCQASAEWFSKSALQGNAKAMFNLAILYQRGLGVPKDRINAFAWYMVSEMDGNEEIQEEVKKVLANATVSERRKAIERTKDIIAKLNIAPMFSLGSKSIERSNQFHRQFELAQLGAADEQFALASMYHEGVGTVPDPFEAAVWCRKAAEQGNVDAMRTLAFCLEDGDGVTEDLVEMAKWYRKAAEKDDIESQFKLGVCFKDGTGVEQDQQQAEFWTNKAADHGHPIAQANMGSFILFGGDEARFAEATKWFKLSARQGHPRGMYKYGMALFLGMGIAANRIEGAAWSIAALPNVDDDGLRQAIKDVIEKLTPEERKKAEAAAIEIEKTL